jgi:hypothetical protein
MNPREGDLIETLDGNIFDVKGLVHPHGKIVAFIRFLPDPKGDRKRRNIAYSKVYPLWERYELLRERFPQYLVYDPIFNEWLCEVPVEKVKKHYKPIDHLRRLRKKRHLDNVETQALWLADLLKKKGKILWSKLGISGSLLVGLYTAKSDIDLIVYGSQNCQRIYEALQDLVKTEGPISAYNLEELKSLFFFRSEDTKMEFEDFVRTESRKILQGKFNQKDYFIRCIKDWDEIDEKYSAFNYSNCGYAKIKAKVIDDTEAIYTPCRYKIVVMEILEGTNIESIVEIVSFRGRFCEQAKNGEVVVAQGKIEKVKEKNRLEYYRLLLGNKSSDYMILA